MHGWPARVLSSLIAVGCLVWVFHDVELRPMLAAARTLRWEFVALAIAFDIFSFVAQGIRWKLLLAPVGRLSWLDATQAVYAGLFANEMLPMRAGEVLRGYIVGRRLGVGFPAVVPSMMVERLFDGVCLAAAIGLAATAVPLPDDLVRAGDVLGLVIVLAAGFFLYVVLRTPGRDMSSTARNGVSPVRRWLFELRDGCQQIGLRRETYLAFVLSLALLTFQIVSFWLAMVAYRLDLALWMGAIVLLIVRLGTAIPNSPANVGSYQFFCVLGLMRFGVEKTPAVGFSVVAFLLLTAPLWLLGAIALSRTGTSLTRLRLASMEKKLS